MSSLCQACGSHRSRNPELHFFRFPMDGWRSRRWILNCGQTHLLDEPPDKLNNRRLCSRHFQPDQFTSKDLVTLNKDAVPTIFNNLDDEKLPKREKAVRQAFIYPERYGIGSYSREKDLKVRKIAPAMSSVTVWPQEPQMVYLSSSCDTSLTDGEMIYGRMLAPRPSPQQLQMLREEQLLMSGVTLINKVIDLCRVCGKPSENRMAKIFSAEGRKLALEPKILRFLPIAVSESEPKMPLHVCYKCVEKLQACQDLYEMSAQAEVTMRIMLDEEESLEAAEEQLPRLQEWLPPEVTILSNVSLGKTQDFVTIQIPPHASKVHTRKEKLKLPRLKPQSKAIVIPATQFSPVELVTKPPSVVELVTKPPSIAKNTDTSPVQFLGPKLLKSIPLLKKAKKTSPNILKRNAVQKVSKDLSCKLCNDKFKENSKLIKHCKLSHSKFLCRNCDNVKEYFDGKIELKKHVKSSHPELNCYFCDSSFYFKFKLRKHIVSNHIKPPS